MRPIAERAGTRPARITQDGAGQATAVQDRSGPAGGGAARGSVVCVLAVSDEVSEGLLADPRPVRSAQLIVAYGDLPAEYLGALMNALDLPLVFVPGNHDPDQSGFRVTRSGLVTRSGFPARPPWPPGAVNADGRVVDVAGLRIAGLGGCLRYNDGPNQYTERQQARRARALRRRARWRVIRDHRPVDLLLTHAPPRGVGDGDDPAHRGFGCYLGLTAALHPPLLLHGHVHPYGEAVPPRPLGGTMVRNVTGWHLLEVGPMMSPMMSTAAVRPLPGERHAG
jgi:calcineurin-like phosphoesterase family protein